MSMIARMSVVTAIAVTGAMTSAYAAEPMKVAALGDVSGKVLVNQGRGFVSAKPGMQIRSGDRIVALDGASAQVVFGDGCVTDLKENNLLAVDGKCTTKPVNPRADNIKLAQAIGGGTAGGGGAAGGGAAAAGGAAGGGMAGLIIPAVGLVTIVGATLSSNNDATNDTAPISAQ